MYEAISAGPPGKIGSISGNSMIGSGFNSPVPVPSTRPPIPTGSTTMIGSTTGSTIGEGSTIGSGVGVTLSMILVATNLIVGFSISI